jgi:hypothetical protein
MDEILERVARLAVTAAERLHVRSALNPMLWLSAIASPICFIFAYVFRDIPAVRDLLIYSGMTPIAATCVGFFGFAIFKPDKLQSEDYQLRHETLQIIQQKSGRLVVPPVNIESISNPAAAALPNKEAG